MLKIYGGASGDIKESIFTTLLKKGEDVLKHAKKAHCFLEELI